MSTAGRPASRSSDGGWSGQRARTPAVAQTCEHDENRKGAFMEDNDATEVNRLEDLL